MNENGRWVTMNGTHVFIKDGQSPMDAFIRQKVKNKNEPKKLNNLEYETLCEEFEESLTDEEKRLINSYGVGGGVSSYLNDPVSRDFERTYRFADINNPKGYVEKKLSYLNALNTDLDKKLSRRKTGNESWDEKNWNETIKWNYDMIERDKTILNKMDKIFNEKGVSLDKDIIVYRKGFENLEDIQTGQVRYGYTSTSAISRINKKTPGGLILGNNEFEIIVPKGMKFLPIEKIVPDDVKNQHEILLPRKIQFELIEDKSIKGGWNKEKLDFDKPKNKYLVKAKIKD